MEFQKVGVSAGKRAKLKIGRRKVVKGMKIEKIRFEFENNIEAISPVKLADDMWDVKEVLSFLEKGNTHELSFDKLTLASNDNEIDLGNKIRSEKNLNSLKKNFIIRKSIKNCTNKH